MKNFFLSLLLAASVAYPSTFWQFVKTNGFQNSNAITLGQAKQINLGNNFKRERTQAWSVSAWVKLSDIGNTQVLWGDQTTGNNYRGIGIFLSPPSEIGIQIQNSDLSNALDKRFAVTFEANVWYHVVVTYSGNSDVSGINLYFDGTQKSGTTTRNNLNATVLTSNDMYLSGLSYALTDYGIRGSVDEFSFWTSELTSGNVATIYNLSKPTDVNASGISGLTAWYRGENNLNDSKGSVNGTGQGTPTYVAGYNRNLDQLGTIMSWYDFGDAANRTIVSSKFSDIADKSGNANHLTQATAGNRPAISSTLNGLEGAQFTAASNTYLAKTTALTGFSTNMSVFMLFTVPTLPGTGATFLEYMFSFGSSSTPSTASHLGLNGNYNDPAPRNTLLYYGYPNLYTGLTSIVINTPYLFTAHMDSVATTVYSMYLNNSLEDNSTGSWGAGANRALRIGSRNDNGLPFEGNMYEALIYSPKLSVAQSTKVYNALRSQFNF